MSKFTYREVKDFFNRPDVKSRPLGYRHTFHMLYSFMRDTGAMQERQDVGSLVLAALQSSVMEQYRGCNMKRDEFRLLVVESFYTTYMKIINMCSPSSMYSDGISGLVNSLSSHVGAGSASKTELIDFINRVANKWEGHEKWQSSDMKVILHSFRDRVTEKIRASDASWSYETIDSFFWSHLFFIIETQLYKSVTEATIHRVFDNKNIMELFDLTGINQDDDMLVAGYFQKEPIKKVKVIRKPLHRSIKNAWELCKELGTRDYLYIPVLQKSSDPAHKRLLHAMYSAKGIAGGALLTEEFEQVFKDLLPQVQPLIGKERQQTFNGFCRAIGKRDRAVLKALSICEYNSSLYDTIIQSRLQGVDPNLTEDQVSKLLCLMKRLDK